MTLTVTIDHPDFPDGHAFGVEGVGMLKNREPLELSEETEQSYVNSTGKSVKDGFAESGMITVEGEPTAEVPEPSKEEDEEEEAPEEEPVAEEEEEEAES